jgi:hypothetical protein
MQRSDCNRPRFVRGQAAGHYESWFQRANHPSRPLALWIRYTIFSPAGRPDDAIGELWAIFFDGERGRIATVKQDTPIGACEFAPDRFDVRIGAATLTGCRLDGSASGSAHTISWSLEYESPEDPLLLLPRQLYERGLPKAKALVGSPNAVFRGSVTVDGQEIRIDDWTGSQNHNWGTRHTDSYAWGQVAGFDNAPQAFLECSTAQIRIGPLWTPRMSLVVLRAHGKEYALHSIAQAVRAHGNFEFFDWHIDSAAGGVRIAVHMHAAREQFVGLVYANPPGGTKTCLNTKLAAAEVMLVRTGHPPETFFTRHRAAFEILTDRVDHGIPVVV